MADGPRLRVPQGYGTGVYRRRIQLEGEEGLVRAELEDDFHHFRVSLRHDGVRIVEALGEALRFPWTTCPGAVVPLPELAGLELATRSTAPSAAHDSRRHCTHLFDLAGLAVAHAAGRRRLRRYDAIIPDRVERRTTAWLERDGVEVLRWQLEGMGIEGPAPWAGRPLGKGFTAWAESKLDAETAEAAIVLRRACMISLGRAFPLDHIPRASDMAERTLGACHAFSPTIIGEGLRVVGSTLDFTDAPQRLLQIETERSGEG